MYVLVLNTDAGDERLTTMGRPSTTTPSHDTRPPSPPSTGNY